MRTLPCGCTADGSYVCDEHKAKPKFWQRDATNLESFVGLALFIGVILVLASALSLKG